MLRNLHNEKRQTQGGAEDAATTHPAAVRRSVRPVRSVASHARRSSRRSNAARSLTLPLPFTFLLPARSRRAAARGASRVRARWRAARRPLRHAGEVGRSAARASAFDDGRRRTVEGRRPAPDEDVLRDVYFTDAETGWLVCDRSMHKLQAKDEPRSYLCGRDAARRGSASKRPARTLTHDSCESLRNRERGWSSAKRARSMQPRTAARRGSGSARRPATSCSAARFRRATGRARRRGRDRLSTADGGTTWRESRVEMPAAPAAVPANATLMHTARVVKRRTSRRAWPPS